MGWLLLIAAFLLAQRKEDMDEEEEEREPEDNEANADVRPTWVLPGVSQKGRPTPGGKFGVRRPLGTNKPARKHHGGVDLGAPHMTKIVAPEPGYVRSHQGWSGGKDYDGARALMFQTDRGPAFLFGAVDGPTRAAVGTVLEAGDEIARVGKYPGTGPGRGEMLHLEAYRNGQKYNIVWEWGDDRPPEMLDPSLYIMMMEVEDD